MSKLTAKGRKDLPASSFALPGKRAYPIPDAAHARNALARASANASPSKQAEIRAKVHERYPGMGSKESHGKAGHNALGGMMAASRRRYAGGTDNVNTNAQGMQTMPGWRGGTWGEEPQTPVSPPPSPAPSASPPVFGKRTQIPVVKAAGGMTNVDAMASSSYRGGTARVPGRGSPKVDKVPAMLAPGEAVLNKPAAEAIGRPKIAAANAMGRQSMGMPTRTTAAFPTKAPPAIGAKPPDPSTPRGPASRSGSGAPMSGLEAAMHAHADRLHPVGRSKP